VKKGFLLSLCLVLILAPLEVSICIPEMKVSN